MNNIEFVENLILVRNEPHIYAFSTNTIPNYLKVGDTFRPVDIRIEEWNKKISEALGADVQVKLTKEFTDTAVIDDAYFRDYAVHKFLEETRGKQSIEITAPELAEKYSREFFKDVSVSDVEAAITDIREEYRSDNPIKQYTYYKLAEKKPADFHWKHDQKWELRPNQKAVVDTFVEKSDKKELLMYAVMRFGKSFTAMYCALKSGAKKVLIVSAKADVATEWKAAVEKPECFKDYCFLTDTDFVNDKNSIQKALNNGKRVAVFLTLQNLSGKDKDNNNIKNKLTDVFSTEYDLIIVDETHFGAWAKKYGSSLKEADVEEDAESVKNDQMLRKSFEKYHAKLHSKQKLHLSGTPYNLLYDKTFNADNMIATVQFSDILSEKEKWDKDHFDDIEKGKENPTTGKPYQEFDNPYFGFPRMLRFAFNPTIEARNKLSALSKDGKWTLTEMFRARDGEFVHSVDVLQLMKIIDGSETNEGILSFLDIPKIKEHDVCKHMVFVLPYKSSCDAMEKLIQEHRDEFINLSNYEILNVAGHNSPTDLSSVEKVKGKISSYENESKKTITLTVNKMLTGVTVKEWDTMIMLKNTHSAQEYDQAVFRIQNQYVKEYESTDGKILKKDMKPQTILVDFDPMRIFEIQGTSSNIVSAVSNKSESFENALQTELKYFPIVTYNGRSLVKVEPNNIVEIITQYNSQKSILDEAGSIKLDTDILSDEYITAFIKSQSKLGLTNSLTADAHKGQETDIQDTDAEETDVDAQGADDSDEASSNVDEQTEDISDKDLEEKFRMCMANILFYVFLSNSKIERLDDILPSLNDDEKERNNRIFRHLALDADFIQKLCARCNTRFSIDINNKIKNANLLSNDSNLHPEKRAINALDRFGRISDSEIVTPRWICKDMLDYIGIDKLAEIVENGGKVLDIAAKTGEFAYAIFNELKDRVDINKLKNSIYAIPTSGATYEFTLRMYEILGLNLNNLANVDNFNAYDMIKKDDKGNINYECIARLLRQNKSFSSITLSDEIKEGDDDVKFDVVVGNPPYQEKTIGDNKSFAPPIYHNFIDISYILSNIAVLIHPARFLFDGGSTPKVWNKKMLNDRYFKVEKYFPQSASVFPKINIMGGITISSRNIEKPCEAIQNFIVFDELRSIVNKVAQLHFNCIEDIIYSAESYRFTEKMHQDLPNVADLLSKGHKYDLKTSVLEKLDNIVFFDIKGKNMVDIYGLLKNTRTKKYIKGEYLKKCENFEYYKVFLPKSNGSPAIDGSTSTQIIGNPFVGKPNEGHTQTYMSLGKFTEKYQAENLCKYIKTKFCRVLLGTLKITQDNPASKWKYVPLQDFSEKSDINWRRSVVEIDQQLYKKYKLTDEEIAFIENAIKPMD